MSDPFRMYQVSEAKMMTGAARSLNKQLYKTNGETRKNRGPVISRLFSIKRTCVILSLEYWRKLSLFPSSSNYSQPPVFPGLQIERFVRIDGFGRKKISTTTLCRWKIGGGKMRPRQILSLLLVFCLILTLTSLTRANPWNGKVILQAFWWDCDNQRYRTNEDGTGGWYTYLAKLAPRLRELGFDGIWVPPPLKGDNPKGMGYDLYDHYDLGNKFQKGSTGTRFGDQDGFLRMIAVLHANGLEVYPDVVLNHLSGGSEDPNAWGENKFKGFQYASFSGPGMGRWLKSWMDFHPNPHHADADDDWRKKLVGVDICYRGRCCDRDCENAGSYMRDQARQWFLWFHKQTDADGYRFDAVKHFPAEVVEDLLYNAMDAGKPEREQRHYFAVGEFAGGLNDLGRLDDWASQTKDRCGAFDFAFREALLNLVKGRGFFDLGSLPNFQQRNRFKTVPFVNNHDTWRGVFSDSGGNGQSNHTGDLKNSDELVATIDPDNEWARVAYAAAMAVDGSPQVYYEDLFKNHDPQTRHKADPKRHPTRSYVEKLIWCHQKLNFKDGAYKVRFQGSQDLLVIERSARAIIGLNDNGSASQSATISTDFGPGVTLHDYSGSTTAELRTDSQGKVTVTVPPKSYSIWGPSGIGGGFAGRPRRTTQEFQLDDDLGDSHAESLGYGGKLIPGAFRRGGAVWVAQGSVVKLWAYTADRRSIDLRMSFPTKRGAKATNQGQHKKRGVAAPDAPLYLEFTAAREGYYQLAARLSKNTEAPTRAYLKVEYDAPRTSQKF
jgi:alpha-amylase